jgi:hypothetical protein
MAMRTLFATAIILFCSLTFADQNNNQVPNIPPPQPKPIPQYQPYAAPYPGGGGLIGIHNNGEGFHGNISNTPNETRGEIKYTRHF